MRRGRSKGLGAPRMRISAFITLLRRLREETADFFFCWLPLRPWSDDHGRSGEADRCAGRRRHGDRVSAGRRGRAGQAPAPQLPGGGERNVADRDRGDLSELPGPRGHWHRPHQPVHCGDDPPRHRRAQQVPAGRAGDPLQGAPLRRLQRLHPTPRQGHVHRRRLAIGVARRACSLPGPASLLRGGPPSYVPLLVSPCGPFTFRSWSRGAGNGSSSLETFFSGPSERPGCSSPPPG